MLACSWAQEPGEARWLLERSDASVRLRILAFRDIEGPEPDDQRRSLFDAVLPVRELAAAIAAGAQRILDECGEASYSRRWAAHPFPRDALASVLARLSTS